MKDAHCHPIISATFNGIDVISLQEDMTPQQVVDTIAKLASTKYANHDFIIAKGTGKNCNPQLASELDQASTDRPILIISEDGRSCWLNNKSLEVAGINKNTSDPIPEESYYERDSIGNPTGKVVEIPALYCAIRNLKFFTPENLKQNLPDLNKKYSSYGYTGAIDAGFLLMNESEVLPILTQLEQEENLPIRYYTSYVYYGDSIETYKNALESMTSLREEYNTPLVKVDAIKMLSDGIIENCSAYMIDEYIPKERGYGSMLLSPYEMYPLANKASEREFGIHINAVGDMAVKNSLNI